MIDEQLYYPYGQVRYSKQSGQIHYGYTDKELDASSLHYYGGRYYDALSGRFISVDPVVWEYVGNPQPNEAFTYYLTHPQMGNTYSYATNNPLKYIDPDGRKIVISKALRQTPGFMKAWRMFKKTHEGQRLIASLEKSGWTVHIRANAGGRDGKAGVGLGPDGRSGGFTAHGNRMAGIESSQLKSNEAVVLLNIHQFVQDFRTKDKLFSEMAESTYKELRLLEAKTVSQLAAETFGASSSYASSIYDMVDKTYMALYDGKETRQVEFRQQLQEVTQKK